jgi:multiple sugar transport system substrate-binding protein
MRRDNEFRYSRLAHILRDQIMSGFIKPGEYLLSENELCKYYGLSRTSVRKSLEQLQKEGLIVKKVGQGTIVSPDLVISPSERRTLRILTNSPSFFVDNCLGIIIETFQNKFPHVDVKLLTFPSWNFWDSMRTSIELGQPPDLVLITDRHFAHPDRGDDFQDLGDHLEDLLGEFYPRVMEPFRLGDAQTAIPATFSPVYLVYNPELFARYGAAEPHPEWTKEELLEAARKLTVDRDQDGITDLYGLSLSPYLNRWPVIALQNGVKFDETTTRESIVDTLNFFHDALYRQRIATLDYTTSGTFLCEKAAMVLTTAIELAGWRNGNMPFEAKVAPLPFGPLKSTLLVANTFMVHKECQEQELALAFLRTALDRKLQTRLARETGFLSCIPEVNEAVWDASHLASLNISHRQIDNGYFLHELLSDLNVLEDLESEMELFWGGYESAESIANGMIRVLSDKSPK